MLPVGMCLFAYTLRLRGLKARFGCRKNLVRIGPFSGTSDGHAVSTASCSLIRRCLMDLIN